MRAAGGAPVPLGSRNDGQNRSGCLGAWPYPLALQMAFNYYSVSFSIQGPRGAVMGRGRGAAPRPMQSCCACCRAGPRSRLGGSHTPCLNILRLCTELTNS